MKDKSRSYIEYAFFFARGSYGKIFYTDTKWGNAIKNLKTVNMAYVFQTE